MLASMARWIRCLASVAACLVGGAGARAEPAAASHKDAGAPTELARHYYDRLLADQDLKGSDAAYLRLLRNTIYAKAGRTFKDPMWREYFEARPWYRPRAEGAAKLSEIDEANLRTIRRWEAKLAEDQLRGFDSTFAGLVPRRTAAGRAVAARADCEADARGSSLATRMRRGWWHCPRVFAGRR
jgi:hypothetical protein